MGLEQVFHTDEYVNFLNIMAKRPNYSVRNNILIYIHISSWISNIFK